MPGDYVRRDIEWREGREKEYWARKEFPGKYTWIQDAQKKTREESVEPLEDLKTAVLATEEPSFSLSLARSLFVGTERMRAEEEDRKHKKESVWKEKPTDLLGREIKTHSPLLTTSGAYGMYFGRKKPLECGRALVRRINYHRQRKIGSWHEPDDTPMK